MKKGVTRLADTTSKSWFAVFDNPEAHGYAGSPQQICERLRDEWITGSTSRSGAWAYCISAGGLRHVHMVLEDKITMRFSRVKKSYALGMHFQPTKGKKSEAEAYITKQPPYDEKGEEVVYIVRHGTIAGAQGKRNDLEEIADMLDSGMNPEEIMQACFAYRRYERMIKSAYFAKRFLDTPIVREVAVHFLVGETGSGKSYSYVQLCEELGEDNLYFLSDYENGGFDFYSGQKHLFMDEYKGQLRFSTLLQITDVYRTQLHARYSNVYCLWDSVYITSVYPPEALYERMVAEDVRGIDKQQQLFRRITDITYCFIDSAGEYQRFTIPMSDYIDYEELRNRAHEAHDNLIKLEEPHEQLPLPENFELLDEDFDDLPFD
jgi:hypothetical protein